MPQTPTSFHELVNFFLSFINLLIPLIFAGLFVFLVWKIFDSWVLNAGDEEKVAEGRQYAISAVFVFVIMITAWGIVALLKDTLGA